MFPRFLQFVALLSSVMVSVPASAALQHAGKMIDSSDTIPGTNITKYGYGPAVVYTGGEFHMFYCSTPDGQNRWDVIRYTHSPDGRMWSAPEVVLRGTDDTRDHAACDPSVVYYNNEWYLFYSGHDYSIGTFIAVARSPSIHGPYTTWSKARVSGTDGNGNPYFYDKDCWGPGPDCEKSVAQPIIVPSQPFNWNTHMDWYGAGEQTVVVKNGELHIWYRDDTLGRPSQGNATIFYNSSTDPTHWNSASQITQDAVTQSPLANVESPDIKYNPLTGLFTLFYISPKIKADAALYRRTSSDGIHWSAPETLCDAACMPDYAHNPGISGDPSGQLIDGRGLIVYGAPYDLTPLYQNAEGANAQDGCYQGTPPSTGSPSGYANYCWGYWDLYATALNPIGPVWNEIPWGWTWLGSPNTTGGQPGGAPGTGQYLSADFDGDGKPDRTLVDANNKWHVLYSQAGSVGSTQAPWGIPWGWQWAGVPTGSRLAVADYDGDHRADRALVTPNGGWYVIYSAAGSNGSSQMPWGIAWGTPSTAGSAQLVVNDYDGDGKADRAWVSPENTWHVIPSTGFSIYTLSP